MPKRQTQKLDPNRLDIAVDGGEERVDALMRIETLHSPHALERFRRVCFAFADDQRALSVAQLRNVLQVEDHLDWLLRQDMARLQLWRTDARRSEALAISMQVADLWQALGVCLGRYALDAPAWVKNAEHETGLLPLTIAVALHCHVNEMRWRARAEKDCDVPLRALHRLYGIAESHKVADQQVYPYEADVEFSITPKGQYVLMLLMADLAERELPHVQRLVAQHWLSSWAQDVVLDDHYVPGTHGMLVNLDSAAGIQRIAETVESTYRYLDIRAIGRRIEETDAYLANRREEDDSVKELTEATEEDFAHTIAWLEKLYHDRSAAFQTARERQAAAPNRFARMIVGWNSIQEFIDASTWDPKTGRGTFPTRNPQSEELGAIAIEVLVKTGTHVPVSPDTPGEQRDSDDFPLWRIRDTSAGGYGLSSEYPPDADHAVGTLVLICPEGETRWDLGRIVRKFKGLDTNDVRFGVQVTGIDAVPVRLKPRPPEDQVKYTVMGPAAGLFLRRPEKQDQQDLLLISSAVLAYTRRFELKTGQKRLALHTTVPVQSAGAWVMIQFTTDD